MSKEVKALEVAKVFLCFSNENRTADDSDNVTQMKLQKLLYYAQGYYLAEYGEPLFKEKIYAWEHGPVVKEVYDVYKIYGRNEIIDYNTENNVDTEYLPFLSKIYDRFGKYTAYELRNKTHSESPWKNTNFNQEIKLSVIESFFNKIVESEFNKNVKELENGTSEYIEYSMDDLKKLADEQTN